MGYAISVKFKNKDECQEMFDFLNQDKTQSLLKKLFPEKSNSFDNIPFDWLSFETGETLSDYAPQSFKDKRISCKQHMISSSLYHLFIWMAGKSSHRTKDNNPCYWYDDEQTELIEASKVKEYQNKDYSLIDNNGFWLKKENDGFLNKLATFNKVNENEKQKEIMQEIDNLFADYKNELTKNPSQLAKMKI